MIESVVIKQIYQGDGETTQFPFAFPFESANHVKVAIYDISTGAETQLESDYYVDAAASKVLYPGYPPGEEPPENEQPGPLPEGQKLVIYRSTPVNQLKDLGDKYPLPILEEMVDKTTLILQEFGDKLDRALIVEMAAETTPTEFLTAFREAVTSTVTKASEAAQSAENASTSEQNAAGSAEDAADSAEEAADALAEAKQIASVIGVVGEPYDPTKTYNPPDLVIVANGSAFRCIAQSTGEDPTTSSKWVAVSLAVNDTFVYDDNGDIMPRQYAQNSDRWHIDENDDIYPAAAV